MSMEKELDLRDIFRIVQKRIIWLLVIPVTAVLTSALISFFLITPQYEASTTLLIGRASDMDQIINQELMMNRQLVSTYSEIAKSRSVAEAVIKELRLNMTSEELIKLVTVSAVKDTGIIAINVKNSDPKISMQIANQVAASFSKKIIGYSNIDNVIVVDEAAAPTEPVSPNKKLNIAVAGILGIALAFALIFSIEFLDNTIKTAQDVEHFLELTVLAAIPATDGKGGK